MGRRGPKPKPNAIKEIEGRPVTTTEPKPKPRGPDVVIDVARLDALRVRTGYSNERLSLEAGLCNDCIAHIRAKAVAGLAPTRLQTARARPL